MGPRDRHVENSPAAWPSEPRAHEPRTAIVQYPKSVTRNSFHRITAAAGLLAVVLAGAPSQATAQAPPASTRERINRIGADLFSASPHAPAAIAELKTILAAEPGSAEAHLLLGLAYR